MCTVLSHWEDEKFGINLFSHLRLSQLSDRQPRSVKTISNGYSLLRLRNLCVNFGNLRYLLMNIVSLSYTMLDI